MMRSRWLWIGVAVLAIVASASITVVIMRHSAKQPDAWEQEHHAEIVQLKSEAESLAIAGKLPEAHAKYREIMNLVGGRQLKDPLLFDEVEQAKTDQDRVYNILLKTMERDVAPVAVEPAPVVSQSTQPSGPYPQALEAMKSEPSAQTTAPTTVEAVEPAETIAATQQVSSTEPVAVAAPRPAPRKLPPTTQQVLDQQIGDSIKRAVDFLLSNFEKDELKAQPGDATEAEQHGLNALCVYALLQAGQATRDERLSIKSPLMKSLIERMKKDSMSTDAMTQAPVVYARSLRAAALAVYNRPEDRSALKADVDWLGNVAVEGAYTYDDRFNRQRRFAEPVEKHDAATGTVLFHGKHNPDGSEANAPRFDPTIYPRPRNPNDPMFPQHPRTNAPGPGMPGTLGPQPMLPNTGRPIGGYMPPPPPTTRPGAPAGPALRTPWDNSNSQYGLLGVWSGAECGIEVPNAYWKAVEKHWTSCQLADGRWGYQPWDTQGTYAMTAAGIASLMVTHDYLDAPTYGRTVGRDPYSPALQKAFAWLESGDNSIAALEPATNYIGYSVYGLERVGLASGYKYFGKHDWYSEIAQMLLGTQWPSGAFGRGPEGFDSIVDTAFTTLFLARGRHPVMMNKLRFEKHWTNRPRDLANLARFASRQLERPLNWQVVNLSGDVDWSDWLDSPVLYIASHEPPSNFGPREIQKLRNFVLAGGLIFTHADASNKTFSDFVEHQLAPQISPTYEMRDVPVDDVIYNAALKMKGPLPKLRGLSNGSRWLLIHSPTDLSLAWQTRNERVEKRSFELGVNMFVYAAGLSDFRNRLDSPYVPAPPSPGSSTINVARISYAGNWDPEPYAWIRFARWFQWETDQAISVQPIAVDKLTIQTAPIAHVVGTAGYVPADADIAALRGYVNSGGILLIDACGGSSALVKKVGTDWLAKLLAPNALLASVTLDDPLLSGKIAGTEKLARLITRPNISSTDAAGVKLQTATIGKGRIIYCSGDLISGLLGVNTLGISGYKPAAAMSIVKNAVLLSESSPVTP
jgi:hypothetical protein